MNDYTDIMLDIETFGTGTNAAIVQIGAVAFNADGENASLWDNSPEVLLSIGSGFRMNVDLGSSKYPGVINASTVEWWLKQSEEARASITDPTDREELGTVLALFTDWIRIVGTGRNNVRLWSNGPTFDEMIVRQAFERYGMDFHQVVSFRQSRCCRTMIELAEDLGWSRMAATEASSKDILKHDGLGDAVYQARMLVSQRHFIRLATAHPTAQG